LIAIIENTGFVVKPYFYFPEILSTISNLTQVEQQGDIHKLILQLIGTLGAVDPYLVKQIKTLSDTNSEILELPPQLTLDENDAGMRQRTKADKSSKKSAQQFAIVPTVTAQNQKLLVPIDELKLSKEDKYPSMAIQALLKVLVDPNLHDHHKVCLDGIKYIVRNQPDCMPFMPMLIPPLLHLMKQNEP
jgi:serine/threonine-protein kinase mTOR